jgi:histidine kinase/DNA gyrase B/HSP90-like ATPase
MPHVEIARDVKFRVLPRLLDHIGLAMYSSVPKAISELVANSHDAHASEVFIDFTEKAGRLEEIVIRDNGHGMSPEALESAYLSAHILYPANVKKQ